MSARVFVPGRIEVLGKHTDYAGGSSLLVAVDRGFTFEADPLDGDEVVIVAEATGETIRYRPVREGSGLRLAAADVPAGAGAGGVDRPGWSRYVDGLLERLASDFGDGVRGVRLGFRSTLPVAAGLSSSSALVTGMFLGLDSVCRFSTLPAFGVALPDRVALATWLAAAEMGGPVGMRGGSEDHTAILCAEPGRVVRYRLAPIRYRGSAPVPAGWTFAVAASGVVADKGGAVKDNYNRLSDLAADAARAWAAGTARDDAGPEPNLGQVLEDRGDAAALLEGIRAGAPALGLDPEPLLRRAGHFIEETALVDAAFRGLEAGDVEAFAEAANHSAAVGAELLENQVPETLGLVRLARELGAPAASPFGAGFGGAVWALVQESEAEEFLRDWERRYLDAFPERADAIFFATPAAPPAA